MKRKTKLNIAVEAVVLAAGLGTRMKSDVPKVLHKICEKPVLWWVLRAVFAVPASRVTVVCGHGSRMVEDAARGWYPSEAASGRLRFALQKKQLGSGDALKAALTGAAINRAARLLVLPGDAPLLSAETLARFVESFRRSGAAASVLSAEIENPSGYGRIIRSSSGDFLRIVEEKDASEKEKIVGEINTGVYCFEQKHLRTALSALRPLNAKKEYYLTDATEIMLSRGHIVVAKKAASPVEALGINTRCDLAAAEKEMRRIINSKLMLGGVTFVNPEAAYVGPDVSIGRDTVIFPGVIVKGRTSIGPGCTIGQGVYVKDSVIGARCGIRASYIYDSKISSGVLIGPFAHIRPGTVIKSGSRVGNFTEIKNSFVGEETKLSHLAYVGDAFLEGDINVGAGAITCNYDGARKHRTRIGKGSFIGSNVNLVAPVKIGRGSLVGAGSTITRNVPSGTLAIERGLQIHKPRKRL